MNQTEAASTIQPPSSIFLGSSRIAGELIALVYIAIIATIAAVTGAFYVMFPELGALSHDVFTRPRGTWAGAPFLLAVTPMLTGLIGIVFTNALPYGFWSVMLTVGSSVLVLEYLKSPIAPAISAGLLPLVVGIHSWWYPPGILMGSALLAGLSIPWKSFIVASTPEPLRSESDLADDIVELAPSRYAPIGALIAFVAIAVLIVKLTGLRFILFPPLVVIGFEMFGHPEICPWARAPFWLPVACFLTALGGFVFCHWIGTNPLAATLAMAWGIMVLRIFDLHVPPALAVALLPMVMDHPTWFYPLSVGLGTLLMTLWFVAYQLLTGNGGE